MRTPNSRAVSRAWRDVITCLFFNFYVIGPENLTFWFHFLQSFQPTPRAHTIKSWTNTDATLFDSTVSLIYLLVSRFRCKICFNILKQIWLVTFESSNVIIATVNYQLTSFCWVLIASKAKTTPLRARFWINSGIALMRVCFGIYLEWF